MADKSKQTQTTAPPASTSPEGKSPSATPAAAAAAKTESKAFGSLESKLEAAFAAAEAPAQTETPQATRGRQPAPTSTEEEVDETESEGHTEETTEETETEETSEQDATEEEEATEETAATEEDESVELDDVDELTAEAMKKVKGADKVPKGFVKRLVKQSAQIRDLKTQLAAAAPITITPTPLSPLADVETVNVLNERLANAKAVKAWAQAHPEGETITKNGREIEITPQQVKARLARAEAEIEAYADRKIALNERETLKPWETAEKIVPGLLKPNTQEHQMYVHLLNTCPELKERFTDHEIVIAYAIKGHRIATEEASGKAKYVRMELDAKGKPVVPTGDKTTAPTVKPKPKAPASPQATRPALQTGAGAHKRTRSEVIASLPEHLRNDPEARLRALIENAEAA